PLRTEQALRGQANVIQLEEGVSGLWIVPHADVAHDVEAGGSSRHDEHRAAFVHGPVRVGDRHHDEERGVTRVRCEPLAAGDHPLIALAQGARSEHGRIGPALRLGHREAGHDLVFEERFQIAPLLFRRAIVGEDFAVAGVRRLAAEYDRTEGGAAEDLVHQRELDLSEAAPAQLGTEMAGPQPALPDDALQWPHQGLEVRRMNVPGTAQHMVERLDFVAHEAGDPVELDLKFGIGFEVPCHGRVSFPHASNMPPSTSSVWPTMYP